MDVSLNGTRPVARRATPRMSSRFSGFEVLMFGLLGVALADCAGLAWLFIRGIN